MDKLIVTPDGFKHWKLVQDFEVETSKGKITIPQGARTDGASVPRILWWLLPPTGRYFEAAVLHDHLCWTQEFTRKETDLLFKEVMLMKGTYKWKVNLMYPGVRIGSWVVWNRNKKKRFENER